MKNEAAQQEQQSKQDAQKKTKSEKKRKVRPNAYEKVEDFEAFESGFDHGFEAMATYNGGDRDDYVTTTDY